MVAEEAGFVGSHLCARLLELGYGRVVCLDNLSTGSLSKVEAILDNSRFVFLHEDVTEITRFHGDITEIYYLACPESLIQYQKNPVHTFETSIPGSINLLKIAHLQNARILLASTSRSTTPSGAVRPTAEESV